MAQTSGKTTKYTLRLVVDEEKKKVVLAEACRDFVDVLFSLLTLPMGTIVRLLESHRKSQTVTVGCFTNLYRSVVDLGIHYFQTEACKEMLLNPRSTKEVQCKRLKLNINPTEGVKYFGCEYFIHCKLCSDFSTSWCRCLRLMNKEVKVTGVDVVENKRNDANGIFVRGKSCFIITDDLKVQIRSTDLVLEKLKSQGYDDVSKVGEKLVDIGLEEVLTLLESIFSSETPLTDTFLNKQTAQGMMKICDTPSLYKEDKRDESETEAEEVITLCVIVRTKDMKILYAECGQDFVDLLFTFLAVPLESLLENISTYGCIGNLFGSFKDLSVNEKIKELTSKSVIPHYYRCQKKLLNNIITEQPPVYYCIDYIPSYHLTKDCTPIPAVLIDPKSHGGKQSPEGSGFVKRDTKFTVTDDLIITPMNSSSTICLLKKLKIQAQDLEVQEISITKIEATSLLRASLVTSSALNTSLKKLIAKV